MSILSFFFFFFFFFFFYPIGRLAAEFSASAPVTRPSGPSARCRIELQKDIGWPDAFDGTRLTAATWFVGENEVR